MSALSKLLNYLGNSTTQFSISSSWEIFAFLVTSYYNKPLKMFGKSWRDVFPNIAYTGMLQRTGYGFWPLFRQGIQFHASLS